MTFTLSTFQQFSHVWHRRRLLALGPARGNRLCIALVRSYVSPVMALALKRLTSVKCVFKMRGFWAGERLDGGLWPREGRMYRVSEWFERRFPYLQGAHLPSFSLIPTCADFLPRFTFSQRPATASGFVMAYVGSAGI